MKKAIAAALCLVLAISLTGCGKYVSSYKAVGFVHSNEKTSAFMNFYSFDGTMVFRLKCKDESTLKYTAKLGSGRAVVYCGSGGSKTELFSLNGGDAVDSDRGNAGSGTVYVIVETDGSCLNGELDFRLE